MKKQTHLYQHHIDAGAKMVDFGDWSMPLHYGSQLKEHQIVKVTSDVGFVKLPVEITDTMMPGVVRIPHG